ncbi:MAG: hypothetical protein ACTSQQ_06990 [Candidatus Helarchaeota archaeon]
MGILHDKIASEIATYFIQNKTFGNRFLATKLPIFPKPDIVLLGLSKQPQPQIAFELKPPHAVKREYLTGLGQAVSYMMMFPLVYLLLPDEFIDGIHIPTFIAEIIEKSNLKIGVISYNISTYKPNIVRDAVLQDQIDVASLEEEISKLRPRTWLFWMDTSLSEVVTMLKKIAEVEIRKQEGNIKKIVLDEVWDEVLIHRYPNTTRPASFKLNYQLFLDTLELWTGDGRLTILGNRIYEICRKYGGDSNEFKNALHYAILTEGGYLQMLIFIDKIQSTRDFEKKGPKDKLNKLIREIRERFEIEGRDFESEKEKVLPIYEKEAPECWLKTVGIEMLKIGFGNSLTQINEELTRRFSPTFQKSLETDFYLGNFVKNKGYPINWDRIISLIEEGNKNLEIF